MNVVAVQTDLIGQNVVGCVDLRQLAPSRTTVSHFRQHTVASTLKFLLSHCFVCHLLRPAVCYNIASEAKVGEAPHIQEELEHTRTVTVLAIPFHGLRGGACLLTWRPRRRYPMLSETPGVTRAAGGRFKSSL